jgi:hypothetical protein
MIILLFALLFAGVVAISAAFYGWLIMLAIGVLASEQVVPSTVSYGSAFWLGLILSSVLVVLVPTRTS